VRGSHLMSASVRTPERKSVADSKFQKNRKKRLSSSGSGSGVQRRGRMGERVLGFPLAIFVLATLAVPTTTLMPSTFPPESLPLRSHRHCHTLPGRRHQSCPSVSPLLGEEEGEEQQGEEDVWRIPGLSELHRHFPASSAQAPSVLHIRRKGTKGDSEDASTAPASAASKAEWSRGTSSSSSSSSSASASRGLLLLLRLRGGRKRIPKPRSLTRKSKHMIHNIPSMKEWKRMREEL